MLSNQEIYRLFFIEMMKTGSDITVYQRSNRITYQFEDIGVFKDRISMRSQDVSDKIIYEIRYNDIIEIRNDVIHIN